MKDGDTKNYKTYTNLSNIRENIHNNNLLCQNNMKNANSNFHNITTNNNKVNTKTIELKNFTQTPNGNTHKNLETSIGENHIQNTNSNNYNLKFNDKKSFKTEKEDYDYITFLHKKYVEEKESKEKEEAEKRALDFDNKKRKKLTKKLMSVSEQKFTRILKIIDFIICFFVLSDVSLSVYTNTRFTSDEYDLNSRIVKVRFYTDRQIDAMRICIMVIVFFMEILIIIKYYFRLKILQSTLFASNQDTIFSTGIYKKLLLEMIILCIFTPPDINGYFSGNMLFGYYTYSSDSFILLIKIFKLYYLAIIYSHLSMWTSDQAKEIAKEEKAVIGANFAFKATLKRTPFLSIIILLTLTLILLSFMMRIFEYGFSNDAHHQMIVSAKAIENAAFDSYADVFWVVIITMMTVGYGDLFPKTHMGRIVAFISSIIGMIIQSLLIVRLSDFVELSPDERKALNEIKKQVDNDILEHYSKNLIKSLFCLLKIKIDRNKTKKEK